MAKRPLRVWVVDDDQSVRWVLEKALKQADMETRSFERAEHLLAAIDEDAPDVLITDVRMPGMSGLALLERLRTTRPELPIIVITAHSDLENAVAAYKGGAFEYLPKPFDIDEAVELVHKAARSSGVEPEANLERAALLRGSFIGAKQPGSLVEASKLRLNRNDDDFYQGTLVQLEKLRSQPYF